MLQIKSPVMRTVDKGSFATNKPAAVTKRRCNFITMVRQAEIIKRQCNNNDYPPSSNVVICEDGFQIRPMRVMDQVKKYFVTEDGRTQGPGLEPMPRSVQEKFRAIRWFDVWLEDLAKKRRERVYTPSTNDIFRAFLAKFEDKPPSKKDMLQVESGHGQTVEIKASKILEKISLNFFKRDEMSVHDVNRISDELLMEFLKLKWAPAYLKDGSKRRHTAKIRNVVTKDMKLELMLNIYHDRKPRWTECVDVMLPDGSGNTFRFHAATWLDDLTHNFIHDAKCKPGVVLDDAQKIAIASLPWFPDHLHGLIRARQLRPLKKALFDDDDEDDETGGSDGNDGSDGNETDRGAVQ